MSPISPKTIIHLSQESLENDLNLGIHLKFHGTSWPATISSITDRGMSIVVEGFIPITISQKVNFSIKTKTTFLEISGRVSSIIGGKKNEKLNAPHLGHMLVQVTWPHIDEFTSFKLKTLLGKEARIKGNPTFEVNFSSGNHDDIHELGTVFPQNLQDQIFLPELAKASHQKIMSTIFECPNESGQNIVGYLDHQEHVHSQAPVIILTPGYGETKREYLTLAYFLASNGFNVLRYDHTNHVGESEGDHEQTSLTNMKQDLSSMLRFAKRHWGRSKVGMVATSLAGRVALKVLSETDQVDQLIVISGIVDVRSTLKAVHQEDLIGGYLNGEGRGVTNILGFNVDGTIFLKDTVEGIFSELATTIDDVKNVTTPVVWFSAEQDAWVDQDSFQQVMKAFPSGHCRSFVIPEGLHRLQENPRKAKAVYRQIVFACQEQLSWHPECGELVEPSRKDIGLQNRIERDRNQTRKFQHEADHVDFWSHYLSNFHYIANSHDYMAALDHIYHLLGHVAPGERLLDAGCGNGHFGSFLFAKEWMNRHVNKDGKSEPIQYVGVDFVETALAQAKSHLQEVLSQAQTDMAGQTSPATVVNPNFYRLDLNKPLPFQDGSFDRIMSNLVVGYLRDPAASIRDLYRVLAPGGRMVLTNLKPCSDLTQIYRNFVDGAMPESAIHEAREVLNNSSHIRQGESEGAFQFYTQEEFKQVLESCGVEHPQVYPTFGNQAFIGMVEKPAVVEQEHHDIPWTVTSLVAA